MSVWRNCEIMTMEAEILEEKYIVVPLCPPQSPHWLVWTQIRGSSMEHWQLVAWCMEWYFWVGERNDRKILPRRQHFSHNSAPPPNKGSPSAKLRGQVWGTQRVACWENTSLNISVIFLLNNQTNAQIIQIYSVIKLYMFRASSLLIIRIFSLYIRHW
jgi:hypothetical protein